MSSADESSEDEGGLQREIVGVAVAKFDFAARKVTELSFKKGDVINVFLMVCSELKLLHFFCVFFVHDIFLVFVQRRTATGGLENLLRARRMKVASSQATTSSLTPKQCAKRVPSCSPPSKGAQTASFLFQQARLSR